MLCRSIQLDQWLEESRQYCHGIDYYSHEYGFDGVEPYIERVHLIFVMCHILASIIYCLALPGKPDILHLDCPSIKDFLTTYLL